MANECRKRRHWWLGLVAGPVLVAAGIGAWTRHGGGVVKRGDEPVYQGKSLSAWLVEASTLPDDTDAGLSAIREIGPSAVPYLVKAFREGRLPRRVQRDGRDVLAWEIQEHAAQALKALGPLAAEAVPSLVECVKTGDKERRSRSAEILGRTGIATKPVRDALRSALNDEDCAYQASHSLGVLGRGDTNVVGDLIEAASSGKKSAAYWAAVSFVELGAKSKPALPVLIKLASHPTRDSDWAAVKAIGMIGPGAADAVPVLIDVLRSGGPWAQKCAAISLGRIGPAAKAAIPILHERLDKEDSNYIKADIARALWRIDPDQSGVALTAAQSIVEHELRAADAEERISYGLMSALDLLGELGTNAAVAMPVVAKALRFNDSHVQLCAAWAAGQIEPTQTRSSTNVLWRLVDVENYPSEDFGNGPFSGLASLKRDRESYHIRVAAAGMLWQMDPKAKSRLKPVVKQLLKEWNQWTSMKSIIPEDVAVVPALEEVKKDGECRELHSIAEEVLEDVNSAKAERW